MTNRWWRAYDEALHDPKLQRLPPPTFKTWFNIMCVASKNGGVLPSTGELAFELRMSDHNTAAALAVLAAKGLIDKREDGRLEPHNWGGRQYKSDVSNERVKRHRARYNNVTSAVTVTPPDTDTDTDTERKKDSEKSTRKSARASRLAPDWQPSIEDINYAIGKGLTEKRINTEAEKFRNYWIAKSGNAASKLDWHATWQNWILNACERGGLPNGRREQTLGDTARELADEIREREHSLGIGRPARDVGRG